MTDKHSRKYLNIDDIRHQALWKYSDDDELLYPVTCISDLPDDIYDLFIRAQFTTPMGINFMGYLVGIDDIFSITIFYEDKIFHFNKNLPQLYLKKFTTLSDIIGKNIELNNFSPLKYITDIDIDGFDNIEGVFEL